MSYKWQRGEVQGADGTLAPCVEPEIISASRSTDIPAFYGEWFKNRLRAGYCVWRNPFNGKPQHVSFRRARVFVFWTKYAAPFLPVLDTLDAAGVHYYFLHTLNHYASEQLEPGVPALADRVAAFKELSMRLGPERVVWRFDPLVITPTLTMDALLDRVAALGAELAPYTRRLVVSFIDIERYRSVQRNLAASGVAAREFTEGEMREFCVELGALANSWGLDLRTCAEEVDLRGTGIEPSACIDPALIQSLWPADVQLQQFIEGLGRHRTDPGQRLACGCMPAKDIGHYSTCRFGCTYCYACHEPGTVTRNSRIHDPLGECLV